MPLGGWVRPLSSTLGVAAAAAAAQLGIAYGFAILRWTADFTDPGEAAWTANLTWVCWLSATAVVLGAMAGGRLARTAGLPRSYLTQVAVVLSAAIGALVTVPLVAVPARYAELAGDAAPAATAARIAVVGVVLGAVVSVGVLLGRPLAWNVIATGGWLWLVALTSVLVTLGMGEEPDAVRLGVWSTEGAPGWFLVMTPMLVTAIGLGAGIAWYAKRQGRNRVAVAVCGAPGPVLVAVAYLVAGPGSRPEASEQFLPYLAAPYTVLAGLLGSLLVAAIERPDQAEDDTTGTAGHEAAAEAAGTPPDQPDDSAAPPGSGPDPGRPLPALPASVPPPPVPPPVPEPPADPSPDPSPRPWSLRIWSARERQPETPPPPDAGTRPLPYVPAPAEPPDVPDGDAGYEDQTSTQMLPAVPHVPADAGEHSGDEWDDDERWLEQIRGGDDPVRRAPPSPDRIRPRETGDRPRPRETGDRPRHRDARDRPRPRETPDRRPGESAERGPLFDTDHGVPAERPRRRWSLFSDDEDLAAEQRQRPDQD